MNKRRLLKLADFLETVPRMNFDMGMFGGHAPRADVVERFTGQFDCGFAGCAMGWAAQGRVVRGLTYDVRYDNFFYKETKYRDGFEAAQTVFGISFEESLGLFRYRGEETPKKVAKRIRKFVALPVAAT